MKIMFSVGEASGDVHGASVAQAILKQSPQAVLFGMGGDKMAQAGVRITYDIKELGCIGIWEIAKKIPFFFRLRDTLVEQMKKEKPDVLVCIDYPGFNMRLMKAAKKLGIPVVYYILPTIWAWHKSRGKDIAQYADKVASIFPFEAKAYEEIGAPVTFVGHPLLDIVKPKISPNEMRTQLGLKQDTMCILLMPGSRKQEVESLFPIMLTAAEELQKKDRSLHFLVPRASTIEKEWLEENISSFTLQATITEGSPYDVMQLCTAAVAASGTATLETALMGLPTVLIYKVAPLTYWLAQVLVHVEHIGLPNIVAGREIIPEFLQQDATPSHVEEALTKILTDKAYKEAMIQELGTVKTALGTPGAVSRVAELILSAAKE